MRASDEAKGKYLESLAAILGADAAADFRVEWEILERRYMREYERRIQDREAANLLHMGAHIVAERQSCHRSTAYRRAERGKIVARPAGLATTE